MKPKRLHLAGALAAAALALASCAPNEPTPVPPAPPACAVLVTVNGDGAVNVNGCGNSTVTAPSPTPSGGLYVKPDYVKITQFGETCGKDSRGVQIEPSGIDRSVRIGCTKALTLSPKCKQPTGPDADCPVPDNAAPDSFEVTAGAEHIVFARYGSASLSALGLGVAAYSGPHMQSDAFNRLATGVSEGTVTITGSYAGVRAQADFVLTVIK